MANVKISRKELEKHIKLTKEIEEKITMFGTPLESVNDEEIEIEVFPNRPDLLSAQGFIRSFLSFLGKKPGLKKYKLNKPEKDYEVVIDKNLMEIRPYTACAIIKELKFDDAKIKEVIDIQEKIHTTLGRDRRKIAIGIYPLEKIKPPINFLAKDPNEIKFVPLEANCEMTGKQVLSRHPTGRDYAHLLEGYDKYPVFIDSNNEILSMPPIINSHKTGKITEKTKDIFIECSGSDLQILKKTLNILVTMFSDMGGEIYQMNIKHKKGDYITPDLTPEKKIVTREATEKLLGLEVSEKDIINCLEKMGYNCKKIKSGVEVEIPSWRTDILHEHDLIEDVAIAYGFDKIIPEMPNISTTGGENPKEVKKRKIAEVLSGLNMLELSNYHLTTKEDQFKRIGKKKEGIIELEDSKTEYNILRQDLLHYALKILSQNVDSEYPQKIFELGRVFQLDESKETGVKESERLSIAIADSKTGFTEIKQVLDYLMRTLSIDYIIKETDKEEFIEGRCGEIIVNNKGIGHMGEIKPIILHNLRISMPVSALEIDFDSLF